MTGPLLILAAFTCVIGFIGLPHLSSLHGLNLLHTWLDASLVDVGRASLAGSIHEAHLGDGKTIGLMAAATAIGAIGIAAAAALYARGPSAAVARFTARGTGAELYRLSLHKFYVDELYDKVIVRPFRWTCQLLFEVIDRFLIDLVIVNGSAFLVDVGSRIARWFQNGQVQRYLVALTVGGAIIFFCASRREPAFTWRQLDGLRVEVTAEVGGGLGERGAKVEFDFDGDGRADRAAVQGEAEGPITFTWNFLRPGAHEVTMWITDPVFDRRSEATRTVTIEGPPEEPQPVSMGGHEGVAP
jgi:hypothetical protein